MELSWASHQTGGPGEAALGAEELPGDVPVGLSSSAGREAGRVHTASAPQHLPSCDRGQAYSRTFPGGLGDLGKSLSLGSGVESRREGWDLDELVACIHFLDVIHS